MKSIVRFLEGYSIINIKPQIQHIKTIKPMMKKPLIKPPAVRL